MKKLLAAIPVVGLTAAMTLATVGGIDFATIRISRIANSVWSAAAILAEILAGILWLLGTIFLATRMAVFIFVKTHRSPNQSSNLPPQV